MIPLAKGWENTENESGRWGPAAFSFLVPLGRHWHQATAIVRPPAWSSKGRACDGGITGVH